MIMHILAQFYQELETPLDVYYKFFEVYGRMDWDKQVVTMFGILNIEDISSSQVIIQDVVYKLTHNEADEFRNEIVQSLYTSLNSSIKKFDKLADGYDCMRNKSLNTPMLYHLNILDPLIPMNNLGKSISSFNSKRIKKVLYNQYVKNRKILLKRAKNIIKYKQDMLTFFEKIYTIMGKKESENLEQDFSEFNYGFQNDPYGIFSSHPNMNMLFSYYNNGYQCWAPENNYGQLNLQFYDAPINYSTQNASKYVAMQSIDSCNFESNLLQGSEINPIFHEEDTQKCDLNFYQSEEDHTDNSKSMTYFKLFKETAEDELIFHENKDKHDRYILKGSSEEGSNIDQQSHFIKLEQAEMPKTICEPIPKKKFAKNIDKLDNEEPSVCSKASYFSDSAQDNNY